LQLQGLDISVEAFSFSLAPRQSDEREELEAMTADQPMTAEQA
jgi:hypothetical protein